MIWSKTGFVPIKDAHDVTLIVPSTFTGDVTTYGVDREIKRNTLLGTIFGDGSTTTQMIIVQRVTIEDELLRYGINGDNCIIVHQKAGFMISDLFNRWATDIFWPNIEARRKKYDYYGSAMFIIDGLKAHFDNFFIKGCEKRDIIINVLSAHSSDQTQMLDLGLFAIQKRRKSTIHTDENLSVQSSEILKIFNSWISAATPLNIMGCWKRAGFEIEIREDQIIYLKVNTNYADRVRHFAINDEQPAPVLKTRRIKLF